MVGAEDAIEDKLRIRLRSMRHQRVRPDLRQHVKVLPLFARSLLALLEECNPDASDDHASSYLAERPHPHEHLQPRPATAVARLRHLAKRDRLAEAADGAAVLEVVTVCNAT